MSERKGRKGVAIVVATLFAALSLIIASAVDVGAAVRHGASDARGAIASTRPIVLPEEWVWRGKPPINLEYMYGNHNIVQQDYIRLNGTH
jgi:hypothetical protein